MGDDDKLDRQLNLRVSQADVDRLDALAARVPVLKANTIGRAALRLGLALLEKDPARLLIEPAPKRGGKRERKR